MGSHQNREIKYPIGITKLSSITTLLFYLSKNRSIEGKTLLLTIANTDALFSQQSNSYIII